MPTCDERMRIGTAVMWINARRHGERGHVVEGGRTYATVLREDGARLRIRWENLLVEDRAPLRTIVTDLDRAQVRFEIGDDVVFTTRDGSTKRGTIEKLNAKRAKVHCSEQRWDVPYVALRHRTGRIAPEARSVWPKSPRKRARSWMRMGSKSGRCASAPRSEGSAHASSSRRSSRLHDGTLRTASPGK